MGISILMPIRNGWEFLPESMESIVNQTYRDWEIIIGINGIESEEIKDKIRKYANDSTTILNFYNIKSKAHVLNKMLKYCDNKYIAILDVDDKWDLKKLEIQMHYIDKYDVVGTGCKYFGEKNHHPDIPYGELNNFDVNPVINSSVLMRKECCKWNEDFIALEDYELWIRLAKEGKKFFNINETLTFHRIHSGSYFNTKNQSEWLDKIKKMC